MLRPVDIPVLLFLTLPGESSSSFQRLAGQMYLSASEVHNSFQRSRRSGFFSHRGPKDVNRSALFEFLEHGLRYTFPAERGDLTRGIPTAYAAEPLRSIFQPGDDPPPIWPYLEGTVRGYSFEPLYKHAAKAALENQSFYELLALTDVLRDGRAREKKVALEELRKRIV